VPPETKVLELIPKLNEVLIEVVTDLSAERDEYDQPLYKFNKEAFLNAINAFMLQIEVFKVEARTDKRLVNIRVDCDGDTTRYHIGDMVAVKATVEKINPENNILPNRRCWIACIAQIQGKAVI